MVNKPCCCFYYFKFRDGTFDVTLNSPAVYLTAQSYTYTITATDGNNNQGTVTKTVNVRPPPPTINSITRPTNDTTPTITGGGAASGDTVTLFVDGDYDNPVSPTATVTSNGLWSITFSSASALSEGSYDITAKTTSQAGKISDASTSQSITIDTTPPTILSSPIISIADDNSAVTVTFSEAVFNTNNGSGALETSDFVLSINGGTATVASTPSSISIDANNGLYSWTFINRNTRWSGGVDS